MDIQFGKEYLFFNPETFEAVIMKVENVGVAHRTKYSVTFKAQNYIQYEGSDWIPLSIEEFNKLGLVLVCEYDPRSISELDKAMEKLESFAEEIGVDVESLDICSGDIDEVTDLIKDRLNEMSLQENLMRVD